MNFRLGDCYSTFSLQKGLNVILHEDLKPSVINILYIYTYIIFVCLHIMLHMPIYFLYTYISCEEPSFMSPLDFCGFSMSICFSPRMFLGLCFRRFSMFGSAQIHPSFPEKGCRQAKLKVVECLPGFQLDLPVYPTR